MYGKSILFSLIMVLFCTTAALGTSITFTFANGQITGNDTKYYEFDVMAAAGETGTKIGDSLAAINYNTAGFGPNIKTNGKITTETAETLTQGDYTLTVVDNGSSQVLINAEYTGPGEANSLPTTPTKWVHVKIEIYDPSKTAGLSFDLGEMSGEQYQSNYTPYSSVTASDSDDSSLPVELASFTAEADDTKVTLKWETGSEVGNIGFYVYRSEIEDGQFEKISKLIEGAGSSAMGRTYEYIDKKVEPNKTYFYYLEDVDIHGIRDKSDTIKVTMKPTLPKLPKEYRLLQNYPNPFNPETWIPYELASGAEVTIQIYDIKGRLARELSLGRKQKGYYITKAKAAYWDGRNNQGKQVASGVYFYRIQAGSFTNIRRLVLLK